MIVQYLIIFQHYYQVLNVVKHSSGIVILMKNSEHFLILSVHPQIHMFE